VRIVEDLSSDAVFDYDVPFLYFKDYKPIARAERIHENLVNFVKQGKGLVVFHLASGTFETWPESGNLAGRVWERKTSHDPRGPFQVNIVRQDHPLAFAFEHGKGRVFHTPLGHDAKAIQMPGVADLARREP
jgi:uncharacterized protein